MGGILGVGFKLPVEDRGRVAALLAIEGLLAFWFLGDLASSRQFVQDGHHSNLTPGRRGAGQRHNFGFSGPWFAGLEIKQGVRLIRPNPLLLNNFMVYSLPLSTG